MTTPKNPNSKTGMAVAKIETKEKKGLIRKGKPNSPAKAERARTRRLTIKTHHNHFSPLDSSTRQST